MRLILAPGASSVDDTSVPWNSEAGPELGTLVRDVIKLTLPVTALNNKRAGVGGDDDRLGEAITASNTANTKILAKSEKCKRLYKTDVNSVDTSHRGFIYLQPRDGIQVYNTE